MILIKNNLRIFLGSRFNIFKNIEAQNKLCHSYIKKSVYIAILKPEKYVNHHNFAENDPFEFKFGQMSDINEINIPSKFGENRVR